MAVEISGKGRTAEIMSLVNKYQQDKAPELRDRAIGMLLIEVKEAFEVKRAPGEPEERPVAEKLTEFLPSRLAERRKEIAVLRDIGSRLMAAALESGGTPFDPSLSSLKEGLDKLKLETRYIGVVLDGYQSKYGEAPEALAADKTLFFMNLKSAVSGHAIEREMAWKNLRAYAEKKPNDFIISLSECAANPALEKTLTAFKASREGKELLEFTSS